MSVVAFIKRLRDRGWTWEQCMEAAAEFEAGVSEMLPAKTAASSAALRMRRYRERLEATGLTAEAWKQLSVRIIARDGATCQYCGTTKGRMACDHVTPLIRGGDNSDQNLVCACHSCNGGKSAKTLEEWRGEEWASSWRAGRVAYRAGALRNKDAPAPERARVEDNSPISENPCPAVAVVERERADDWPSGSARDHARQLIEAVASPWLDPNKSLDLNTTHGRLAAWKRDGASWEFDVLPVVQKLACNRRSRIGSWKFFDAAVAQSIADNRAALEIPEAAKIVPFRSTGPPRTIDEKSTAAWDYAMAKIAQDEQP